MWYAVVSVGAALFLFQQLAGINAVVYYSTSVFRTAGVASDVAASALVGAANVFGQTTLLVFHFDIDTCKILMQHGFSFHCRNNDCVFFNGQARKEKSIDDKLLRDGMHIIIS